MSTKEFSFNQSDTHHKKMISKLTSGRSNQMQSYVAILLVSVGKENFENESLEAALQMINQEFKGCCIAVADTLQRYNLSTITGVSESDAYKRSLVDGDEWLKRNESYFVKYLNIPYEIVRWDDLINDPSFELKEKKFTQSLEVTPEFLQAMHISIEEYGKRVVKQLGEEHFQSVESLHRKNCFAYLQEECTAITILPNVLSLTKNKSAPLVIVYPGKATPILAKNHDILIKEEFEDVMQNYGDFLNWVSYRFNKIKQTQSMTSGEVGMAEKNSLNEEDALASQKMEHIIHLSQIQLRAIESFFDNKTWIEFKEILLHYCLQNNSQILEGFQLLSQEDTYGVKMQAYLFATQLLAMFNTLSKKLANKCKAHIIKILIKENETKLKLA